jgi:ACS family glucarate transporter-like MFS transporter
MKDAPIVSKRSLFLHLAAGARHEPPNVLIQVVGLATLANALGYMDRVCMSIVSPSLRAEFGFNAGEIGMIFGAFSLSYALFQTPWGIVADRRSVRNLIAVIILLWSLSTGLTALLRTLTAFLVVRFFFGITEAALSPMVASLFRRSLSSDRRPAAFGIFLAGGRVGGLVAPSIAAFFVIRYGWRSVFVFFGAIGLGVVIAWLVAFPRQQAAAEPLPARTRGRAPMSRPLVILILVALLYTMMWQFFATWFPTYLTESRHFSLQRAGVYAGLPFLFGIFSTLSGGPLSIWVVRYLGPRLGRIAVVSGGLLLSAALLYGGLIIGSPFIGALLISLAAGAGDLILSTLWAAAVDLRENTAGAVSGLMNSAANLGAFLSPVLVGKLLQAGFGWSHILEGGVLLNASAALLWIFFRPAVAAQEMA